MLTANEFADWFADYRSRFPAVGDYVDRVEYPAKVLDTWHANVSAFDMDVLRAVTAGLLAGDFEPVANVQLGMFGAEVRKLCRQVLDSKRVKRAQEWEDTESRFSPTRELREPRMAWMLKCASAVDEIQGTDKSTAGLRDFDQPGSVDPGTPYGESTRSYRAAIIMADEHTADEERRCLEAFASEGVSWGEIQLPLDPEHRNQKGSSDA